MGNLSFWALKAKAASPFIVTILPVAASLPVQLYVPFCAVIILLPSCTVNSGGSVASSLAQNIVDYREQNGSFKSRRKLLEVPKLGPKAFEQCAGFLRIRDGEEPLDTTAVHPESYKAAKELLKLLGHDLNELAGGSVPGISKEIKDYKELASKLEIGEPTLKDIVKELERPGRDPREDAPAPILRSDVLSMSDLKEGMILKGTVRNVIDFGVFVDIGVHQDGLVHISKICDRYIKHPLEAVSVGDIVDVMVIGIDEKKGRISLSMRDVNKQSK